LAEEDSQFAEKLKNPKKNIDDCITYILNQVKASGCDGFTDAEIFGMATHYYDEDDIKPGEKIKCDVVVNHKVELTPEEIEEAKKKAREKIAKECEVSPQTVRLWIRGVFKPSRREFYRKLSELTGIPESDLFT
jgi:hypothetical protein